MDEKQVDWGRIGGVVSGGVQEVLLPLYLQFRFNESFLPFSIAETWKNCLDGATDFKEVSS